MWVGEEMQTNPEAAFQHSFRKGGSSEFLRVEAQFLLGRQEFARKTEDGSLRGVLKKKVQFNQKEAK